jgi:hypothetical protein
MNVNVRQLDELSDDQLLRRLGQVTELARPLLGSAMLDITPQVSEKAVE